MAVPIRSALPLLLLALFSATASRAAIVGPVPGPTVPQGASGLQETEDHQGLVHFQVGVAYRFATNVSPQVKQTYLGTGDLSFVRWDRRRPRWGAGIHFAIDDSGHRLGIKGIRRWPLDEKLWRYFQVAPGIYVSATDDTYDPAALGYFLEAELGLAREFAFVASVEMLPHTRTEEQANALNAFVGAKVGQAAAGAASALGLIVGIVVLASIGSSGGIM